MKIGKSISCEENHGYFTIFNRSYRIQKKKDKFFFSSSIIKILCTNILFNHGGCIIFFFVYARVYVVPVVKIKGHEKNKIENSIALIFFILIKCK